MGYDCNSATKTMPVSQMIELIKNCPPGPWPTKKDWDPSTGKYKDDPEKTWHCWDNTQEAMRILADEFIKTKLGEIPQIKWKGRGICIAGGFAQKAHLKWGYWPSIWVCINKIRMLGCTLPIQVWHLGPFEMDPYTSKLLENFNVETVDAREIEKRFPLRILCGWELKVYSALYSPFEEVLFLDADNAPVFQNPENLFSQPEYVEHGSCFWPDYENWDLSPGVWKVFGIEPRNEAAFESGQFMVHKGKCWRELKMSLWYVEHSDFTFGHVYGDKEVFHLGWRKLGSDYAMPKTRPGWEGNPGICIVQHNTRGERVLYHRCQDKWRLEGGNQIAELHDEKIHHSLVENLREIWHQKPWSNPSPNERELQVIQSLTNRKFFYKRLPKEGFNGDIREMVLGPDSKILEGSAECEVRWEINEIKNPQTGQLEMTLAICRTSKPTCILKRNEKGDWVGKWLEYEKCDVILTDIPTGSDKVESTMKFFMENGAVVDTEKSKDLARKKIEEIYELFK